MKNFELKKDSILHEDVDGNYYLLDNAQSIQVADYNLNQDSCITDKIINCRKIEEVENNYYLETDNLLVVQKRVSDLKPTLLKI